MASRKNTITKKRKQKHAYQMMVMLEGSEPKIWRQISVPGNMTLADLDRIIQAAMGWTNSHLHQFTIEGQVYGVLDDEKRNSWPMCLAGANACPPGQGL